MHPAAAAQRLTYGRDGGIAGQEAAARAVGTTVAVRDLFKCLPVRHKVGFACNKQGRWNKQGRGQRSRAISFLLSGMV